jgi:hypothetical protein
MTIFLANPIDLIGPSRLDIVVKYLYAKAYLMGDLTPEIKKLYRDHIEFRTNGIEPPDLFGESTHKHNLDDYESHFLALINSLVKNSFDTRYAIPITRNNNLGNGAHRLAASLALNIDVYAFYVDGNGAEWGFDWFRSKQQFSTEDLTLILNQWSILRLQQNRLNYLILWSPIADSFDEALLFISNQTVVTGYTDYHFDDNEHLRLFLLNLYAFNTDDMHLNNIKNKALRLSSYPLFCRVVIIDDLEPYSKGLVIKRGLRSLFHSKIEESLFITAHALDTFDELEFFTELLFDRPELKNTESPLMLGWMHELHHVLLSQGIRKNDLCIVGSSVMDIYNIRVSTDIDFTLTSALRARYGDGVTKLSPNVDIVTMGYHRTDNSPRVNDDQLIQNAKHHFLCRGYKFARLEIIRDRKAFSKRPKDLVDVDLIDEYLVEKMTDCYSNIDRSKLIHFFFSFINRLSYLFNAYLNKR